MADIALKSSTQSIWNTQFGITTVHMDVVEPIEMDTQIAGEAIPAGVGCKIDPSTGNLLKSISTTAPNAKVFGISTHSVVAGDPLTVMMKGVLGGYDFSAQSYGSDVFVSDTAGGALADAAGTVTAKVGIIIAAHGQPRGAANGKVLRVNL